MIDNHWQSLTINRQSKLRLFPLGLYHLLLYHFHLKTILRVYFDVCSLVVDMNMCQQDQLLLGMKQYQCGIGVLVLVVLVGIGIRIGIGWYSYF